VIVPARGKQAVLALEDHREVGRQLAPGAAFVHGGDAEYQPQAPSVGVPRAGKAHPQTAAIGPRTAVALELGVAPVDVKVERAADARAQIAVATGQTAGRGGVRRGGGRIGRRGGGQSAAEQQRGHGKRT